MDDRHEGEDRGQPRPPGDGVRIIGAEEAAAALESGSVTPRRPEDAPRLGDRPAPPEPPIRHRFPLGERDDAPRIEPDPTPTRVELPHWTEPATGEVPRILADDAAGGPTSEDDLEAWSTFAGRAPRWRDQQTDWDQADFDDASHLVDDDREGAMDTTRTEHSDLYEFEDAEPVSRMERRRGRSARGGGGGGGVGAVVPERPMAADPLGEVPEYRQIPVTGERDVVTAVVTGVGFAVIAGICFRTGPLATLILATAVVSLCAVELFDVLRRAGYRPATLLGLTATVSAMLATYNEGEGALPLVVTLTMIFSLLWYLAGVVRARPTVNVAVTLMGFFWVGFLGSFAGLLLRAPDRTGVAFLFGAVLATVAFDVGGFFVGRMSGRTPLAPNVSPNKTWEGFLGGAASAVLASVIVVRGMHPWDLKSAFALGLVVSVVAPLGDLCESMVKRDLGVKDMGTILPGHGGMIDRFDAMLFVLPATYYLVRLLELG